MDEASSRRRTASAAVLRARIAVCGALLVASVHVATSVHSTAGPLTLIAYVGFLIASAVLREVRFGNTLSIALGMMTAMAVNALGMTQTIAQCIPVVVQGLLAALVWRTLRPGHAPAVQRIAESLHSDGSPLPADIVHYTRTVTWIWFALFASLAVMNALPLLGMRMLPDSAGLVSLLDFFAIGIVIALEFAYRRFRYADFTITNFAEFLRRLRHIDWRAVLTN